MNGREGEVREAANTDSLLNMAMLRIRRAQVEPDQTEHLSIALELLAALSTPASTEAPVGGEGLIDRAVAHVAYLRSFDSQPVPASVGLIEGLVSALRATPPAGESALREASALKVGDWVDYTFLNPPLRVQIVANCEGWWEVRCSDESTCLVRPSRLARAALAQDSASTGGER